MHQLVGLHVEYDAIPKSTEEQLLMLIDSRPLSMWEMAPEDRVVWQMGHRYNYQTKRTTPCEPITELVGRVAQRLVDQKWLTVTPNQVIVNRYNPGQGISAHTDSPCFNDEISSLSLGSSATMVFSQDGHASFAAHLPPRSLLVLRGEMRWLWTHAILEQKVARTSVTMRAVE